MQRRAVLSELAHQIDHRRPPHQSFTGQHWRFGAGCIAQNYVNNSRTKHIDVKYHMVRDWIAKKIFELFYIETATRTLPTSSPRRWQHLHIMGWLIVFLMDIHSPSHQSGVCERNLYGTYDVPRED
jgi:hypothetical protein